MFEGSYVVDGRTKVSNLILLWRAHVAFRVDGVVIQPIGHYGIPIALTKGAIHSNAIWM